MYKFRSSMVGRCTSAFAMLAFLLLQVPGEAWAASGTKVTHDAIKYFVPDKRIRLDAKVTDPSGVTLVRAYFKGKTDAEFVFVPMDAQKTAPNSYVAILPGMAKSTESIEYLFLAVNGANEVSKTEIFAAKANNSGEVPSWQMVKDDEPLKLFTEVPNAPEVAASYSDSVSFNVVESGLRFGLVAGVYSASSAAVASGAAAGASNAGVVTVGTTGMSAATIGVVAAVAVAGVAAAASGHSGSSGNNNTSNSSTPAAAFAGNWTGTWTSISMEATGTVNPSCGGTWSGTVNASGAATFTAVDVSGPECEGSGASFQVIGTVTSSGSFSAPLPDCIPVVLNSNTTTGSWVGTFVASPKTFSGTLSCAAQPPQSLGVSGTWSGQGQ